MHMVKIILFVLGITFAVFGYLIVFKKKLGSSMVLKIVRKLVVEQTQMRFELGKLS